MPVSIKGWVIVLQVPGGKCKALPAAAATIDALTQEQQRGLPSLCGVWESESEANDVVVGLPDEIRLLAEVLPIGIAIGKKGTRGKKR